MNQNLKDLLRKFKNKKLLTQLFTVMAAFSAILMMVVSMVVAHQTTAAFINNNNLIYSNTLNVSIQTLDTLFSGFHNSLTHITYDAGIVDSVVTPKPLDSVANYQVWSVLNGYCQETEAIEEIYLYVKETSQILTSTYEKYSLEFFRKKDLVANHFAGPPATVMLKSGRTTSIEMYKGSIYMVRDFPLNGEKGLGTLFMKMKPSILYDSLEGAQTSFSRLLAFDHDWNPLFPHMLDYSVLPEEVRKDIPLFLEQGRNTMYFGNQHYFFCRSDQTGINMVLLVDDFAFMPSSRIIFMNSLPFFALILILSILLSVCVLYLSYMPVQKLKKMISSEGIKSGNEEIRNEWDYLTESFLKISNHKCQLDYILSSMIPKISKEFYYDLLNGKPMELSYIQSILTNINSPLGTEGACKTIAVTYLESAEASLKVRLLEHLSRVLDSCSAGICRYVIQQIDESLYAVILQFQPGAANGEITGFEIRLEQDFFDGAAGSGLKDFPEDAVIPNHHFFQLQLKSISDLIMKGETDQALQKALHICHTLSRDGSPEEICKAYEFYRLAFLSTLAAYRITDTDREEYAFIFRPGPHAGGRQEDPGLIQEYMVPFCTAAIHLLAEKYQKQQHKYLVRAKRYIEENYTDPDLSLNLLAEQCKTTTS
ncbi:hypothetical protein AALB39_21535 [Lachnospiraceae bacterium 54-53]